MGKWTEKEFLAQAERFVREITKDFYNKRRTIVEIMEAMAEDCSWIAAGRQEFFTNKQEALEHFSEQEDAQEVPYLYVEDAEFHSKLLAPEVALVYGRYRCHGGSEFPMIDEKQRCSYIVRYVEKAKEKMEISHIHVSNPWYLMRGTELFPKAVFADDAQDLMRELLKERLPQEVQLSEQQKKVLMLLTLGMTYDAIAEQMNITARTVRYHVEQILNKFYVTNRQELLLRYLRYAVKHNA